MANVAVLREHLLKIEEPLFAVLDGAQFDDLPSELFDGDFEHRPLYRNDNIGHQDRVRTTPQLVWLDHERTTTTRTPNPQPDQAEAKAAPAVLEKLFYLIGERPAVVFWVCPQGGDVLFRHLRTINMVLFPSDASFDPGRSYEANPLPVPDDDEKQAEESGHDLVLFRHADANVMAQVTPALDKLQFARLFGPANMILFAPNDDWGGGAKQATKPDKLPKPPAGPLKLQLETIQAIEKQRLMAARLRRVNYLRDTCGEETDGASDEAIATHIRASEATGRQLGLISEAAHCRWAFIMCKTNGRVMQVPEVHRRIAREGRSPDDQVKRLMAEIATTLKQTNTKVQG